MSSNKLNYTCNKYPDMVYKMANGRTAKPHAVGTCGSIKEFKDGTDFTSSFPNERLLNTDNFTPQVRTHSRFRVSPSPRKIPNYEIDLMLDKMMTSMQPNLGGGMLSMSLLMSQRAMMRNSIPRFR